MIDSITIALIIIAIIPWLGSLFKSLELPGGVKVEYHELQKATAKAKKAGLLKATTDKKPKRKTKFSYQQISSEDPTLFRRLRSEKVAPAGQLTKGFEVGMLESWQR